MKKNLLPIILALLMSFTISNHVFAYENEYVKVKVQSSPIVNLSSDGFQIGLWDKGFYTLFNINDRRLTARLDGYYTNSYGEYIKTNDTYLATVGPIHVKTDKIFYSYEDAFNEANKLRSLEIDAFVSYNEGAFEIWIGQLSYENMAIEEATNYANNFNGSASIINDNINRIVLSNGNNEIILMFSINDNIHLSSLNQYEGLVKVGNNNYRDFITFFIKDNEVTVINNIEIQHYLYGVVPKEMYPGWPLEALKAQAIAAKNYTLLNMNKHSNEGYNLCNTQHCQVYGGYDVEHIMTNRAVDETIGRILTYNDKLVNTYYHASSGGNTESSENIWSESVPYLRGVADDFSLGSPYDSWQFVISKEEVRERLLEIGIDLGDITSIEVVSTSQNGRVQELLIKGVLRSEILKKERTRQIFGTTNIKSTWFEVMLQGESGKITIKDIYIFNINNGEVKKQTLNNLSVMSVNGLYSIDSSSLTKNIVITDGVSSNEVSSIENNNIANSYGKYVFNGRGWGHGVGMSQWGAKKMAELGYSYIDILEYYYTGAIVK
ncbi:MAG: SpoIID/LytB domain-containing protein [Gottschalkiaceae bacterium]|nr:MAG: SpoIID/LytB domain-containing protein [Gottschalkiaceae bacterium]